MTKKKKILNKIWDLEDKLRLLKESMAGFGAINIHSVKEAFETEFYWLVWNLTRLYRMYGYNTIFSETYPYYRDKFNKISDSYDDYYVSQLETKEEESEEDKVERLRYDHFESMADEKRKFKN
jgi:hypothetical protein